MSVTSEQLAWLIRRHGIEMTHISGGSHIGSIMSVADILAVLYTEVLRVDPCHPDKEDRDRFILSKGHASAAVYAVLAEKGFIHTDELLTHYANGSRLSGHVSNAVPGVEFTTGSLGHGLSAAAGMALAARKDRKTYRVYTILGDGECDEGTVWEAALFANHYGLSGLTVVVDHNHMQSLDTCERTLKLGKLSDKWRAFGWKTIEIDGHDHRQLRQAFKEASAWTEGPTVIIADTIKGKGVSFMENDILWHYRFPHDGWEYDGAVNELNEKIPEGVTDPYTPGGISYPVMAQTGDDIGNDHTFSHTWNTAYPEQMRRVEAKSGTDEPVHNV